MDRASPQQIVSRVKTDLLPRIRQEIKCAVLYGSRAKEYGAARPNSDVDFFIVTNKESNPISITEMVVDFFQSEGLACDPFWYIETYFLDAIEAGTDLSLWNEIFNLGQIVYADAQLLSNVRTSLLSIPPSTSGIKTIISRRVREVEVIQSLVRNTDRILTEAILLAYCEAMGVTNWSAVPDYKSLANVAFSSGIIDRDVLEIANTLSRIKEKIGQGDKKSALEDLANVQNRLAQFVKDQTGQSEGV